MGHLSEAGASEIGVALSPMSKQTEITLSLKINEVHNENRNCSFFGNDEKWSGIKKIIIIIII